MAQKILQSLLAVSVVAALVVPLGASAVEVKPGAGQKDLDDVIEQYHRGLDEFVRGSPQHTIALFSQSADVTLGNPFGPFAHGAKAARGRSFTATPIPSPRLGRRTRS